jgi:hypothetical protein
MNIEDFPLPGPSKITEAMLFRIIWNVRSQRSFITGTWLRYIQPGHPLWFSLFAHVLAKGQNKYPYFRHYAKNIIILHPKEHFLYDFGTEEQRIAYALDIEEKSGGKNTCDWNKLHELEEELKEEYRHCFPSHKGLLIGIKYSIYEVQKIIGPLNKSFFDSLRK